jgi:glycosyltransferase involved in cell wall biosynthesis
MCKLIIHATNIHHGGGGVLLTEIIKAIPAGIDSHLIIDDRMSLPIEASLFLSIQKVSGSIKSRLLAEYFLRKKTDPKDIVLCFGNLPPLFNLGCYVATYVQNRFLVDPTSMRYLPLRPRLRIFVEKIWLYLFKKNSTIFFVQTLTMMEYLQRFLGESIQITVASFSDGSNFKNKLNKRFDYVYLASGERHKNHRKLFEAWKILSKQSIFPTLVVTLDPIVDGELVEYMNLINSQHQLKIINFGKVNRQKADELLKNSKALIYPSSIESYGLPLIEAKNAGIPIIAIEADYVRDIVIPVETFDADSPLSISRAVKRFLNIKEMPNREISSMEFIHKLINVSK